MPTVGREGAYRFFFFSNERDEPPHVHVQRDRSLAKFWLRPVRLAGSSGFAAHELTRIEALVQERVDVFLEALDEYFGADQ